MKSTILSGVSKMIPLNKDTKLSRSAKITFYKNYLLEKSSHLSLKRMKNLALLL
jgi:hypothetical protein